MNPRVYSAENYDSAAEMAESGINPSFTTMWSQLCEAGIILRCEDEEHNENEEKA